MVCCCVFPPVRICELCLVEHLARPPYGLHVPLPLHLRDCVCSQYFIETLRKRQVGKEQARHLLLENLAKVEEAEKEIRSRCKWLITAVKEAMDDALSEVWKIREDLTHTINAAIKEVEDHIYDEHYTPSNPLVSSIWNFHFLPIESELSLFSFRLDTKSALKSVKSMIQLSFTTKQRPEFLPIIASTSIRKFYFSSESISPPLTLESAVKIDMTSAWVFLTDGKIFACGRHCPPSNSVYQIDPCSGSVSELSPMLQSRAQQGMILFNSCVYVFGGLAKGYLKTCEKFSIGAGDWKPLPDMREARDGFNPCAYNESFFIVGGSNATVAELFFPATETFSLLSVNLPKASCSVSVIDGDDLIVLQRDAIYRWRLNSSESFFRETKIASTATWSNCPPVLSHGCVLILNCWTHTIGKCNLSNLSFQQAAFTY